MSFQLISSKECRDKSTSVNSPDPGDPLLQESVKELLLRGSRSDCEDKERTEDQLMPLSSSMPLSELSLEDGDCLNAELKSFSGGSNPSELE